MPVGLWALRRRWSGRRFRWTMASVQPPNCLPPPGHPDPALPCDQPLGYCCTGSGSGSRRYLWSRASPTCRSHTTTPFFPGYQEAVEHQQRFRSDDRHRQSECRSVTASLSVLPLPIHAVQWPGNAPMLDVLTPCQRYHLSRWPESLHAPEPAWQHVTHRHPFLILLARQVTSAARFHPSPSDLSQKSAGSR